MGDPRNEVELARAAAAREAWAEAYERLSTLDAELLEPGDLAALADAAWWIGRQDEAIEARTRAYAAYAAARDDARAGWHAGRLTIDHGQRGEPAVAGGWLQRARRHLADVPERVEHGFLAVVEATLAFFGGDLERASELASAATDIGDRLGDRDIWVLGLHTQGLIHVAAGRYDEGLALLDEAMTSVVAGELSDYFTGVVYCNVIDACLQLADVGRAGQWSDAARRWCASIPPESPFPGLCRVNRAQVADLRGAWAEAETEARRASDELLGFDPGAAALACYETGEIRRRLGDRAGAERCFARARELGFDPQPGASLLRLAEGGATAALAALRLSAGDEGMPPLRRARVLQATVDAALAAGDDEAAAAAAAELDGLAEEKATPALSAIADGAGGSVDLARGRGGGGAGGGRRSRASAARPPAGRSSGSPTSTLARASSSGRRSASSATRRAPASSSRPRSRRTNGSARRPTPIASAGSRRPPPRSLAASPPGKPRCSSLWPPEGRTGRSPSSS